MKIITTASYEETAREAAKVILDELAAKPDLLIGLATGETAVGLYQNMIAACNAGTADFSRARTVNLDEYIGCGVEDSYRYFMETQLFNHINIPKENITIADRTNDADAEVARMRAFFEKNRVDIQLLGMGPNGHIGFNEPDDTLQSLTHWQKLTEETIAANARFFKSPDDVPRKAITMGMGDIMKAKKILMVIKGESKRECLRQLLEGNTVDPQNPSTFILMHPDVTLVCEKSLMS